MFDLRTDLLDLLSMMVFSMLLTIVVIDICCTWFRVLSPPRLGLWRFRLVLCAVAMACSWAMPAFMPAFVSVSLVAILLLELLRRERRPQSLILSFISRQVA